MLGRVQSVGGEGLEIAGHLRVSEEILLYACACAFLSVGRGMHAWERGRERERERDR
jgi:hypothetical protein